MPLLALPIASSVAAAISLTVIYFILAIPGYLYFTLWHYSPYLSAALGSGGKFLGFLLRWIFLKGLDVKVYAASTVFITAGMSACTSAQAAVLADWFKHAQASQRLGFHLRYPGVLPAVSRFMSIPVLAFGPGIGVPAAVLAYGVSTPDAIKAAMRLRKWSAWGTMACLAVLLLLSLLAVAVALIAALKQDKDSRKACWVATVLMSLVLISISGATRVRNVYHPSISLNDRIYYSLIVLPEVLQQLLTTVPTLLHRTGYAEGFKGWRTATWGWVGRVFPEAEQGKGGQAPSSKGWEEEGDGSSRV